MVPMITLTLSNSGTELGFSGKRPADQVATVWRVMPFGFEADTLEIALREVTYMPELL